MRLLLLFLVFGAAFAASTTSCTKDKPTVAPLDPTCSDTISFSQDIQPLFADNCLSCHDVGNSTGYTFTTHAEISDKANQAIGAMRSEGFELMPQGGPALNDSLISLFQCWIQNGKQNN